MSRIEETILSSLIHSPSYAKKALTLLRSEYFKSRKDEELFKLTKEFVDTYDKPPNYDVLAVKVNEASFDEDLFEEAKDLLNIIRKPAEVDEQWLLDETEKFCQEKAIYNAIVDSVKLLEKADGSKAKIPTLLQDALAISFVRSIGHEYIADAPRRYEEIHSEVNRISLDIEIMNEVTGGGIPKKSLTVFMAETGGGKSLGLGHIAANCISQGQNVLYITLELSEYFIGDRIDANLMDVPLDELHGMGNSTYLRRMRKLAEKTSGRLIIKEYPPATAHAGHFDALIQDLKAKKDFIPDVVIVDYINLSLSQRYAGANHNSYTIIKGAAEELRGLAVKHNVAAFTATQVNRTGYSNSDVDLGDTSESMGLPFTVDLFLAIITNEQLEAQGVILMKQLKNRWGDLSKHRRFLVGIERAKMKWYNVDNAQQATVANEPMPTPQQSRPKKDYSSLNA